LQTRRYRDVLRRKAKSDDIDAYVIAGLLRSEAAAACYVPDRSKVCASWPACGRA
jgi:transposase